MPTIIGLAVGDLAVLSILKSTPRSATLTTTVEKCWKLKTSASVPLTAFLAIFGVRSIQRAFPL